MPPDLNTLSYDPSLPAADISSDLSHLGHRRPSSAWSCWTTIHDYVSVDGKPSSPFASLACMLSAPLREAGRERNEARTTEELVQHQRFHTTSRSPQEISEKSARSGDELSGLAAVLADADSAHQAPVGQGPLVAYQEGLEEGLLRHDPLQERTVKELQRLYDELLDLYPSVRQRPRGGSGLTLTQASHSTDFNSESIRNSESPRRTKRLLQRPWWRTLFGTRSDGLESDFTNSWPRDEIEDNEEEFVEGMYMYGGVGCGKTMLMDLFVACAPPEFKLRRIHFHDFMLEIHAALREHASTPDPLTCVADDVFSQIRVLCLDEFFVTDVADAMILHRLFDRLWDRGLVLVATSNRKPDDLYLGGLQRALFLPFIDRLKSSCVVHDMASAIDYRRLAQHKEGLYFIGTRSDADDALWKRFIELTNQNPIRSMTIEVAMGRSLEIPRVGGCIAHFTFEEICDRPLGAADFIALANVRHTIALSRIPVFVAKHRAAAYRFVTLIDVLYEHKVRLLCSAEGSPRELFKRIVTQDQARTDTGGEDLVVDDHLGFAKDRTISRLTEMQSKEYLRAHAEAHAPELLYALEQGMT